MGARGNVGALAPWTPDPETTRPGVPMPEALKAKRDMWRDMTERKMACQRDAAWQAIPEETRGRLLAMCTDRDPHKAGWIRWRDLTVTEQAEIGACARGLVRDLRPVAGVLIP